MISLHDYVVKIAVVPSDTILANSFQIKSSQLVQIPCAPAIPRCQQLPRPVLPRCQQLPRPVLPYCQQLQGKSDLLLNRNRHTSTNHCFTWMLSWRSWWVPNWMTGDRANWDHSDRPRQTFGGRGGSTSKFDLFETVVTENRCFHDFAASLNAQSIEICENNTVQKRNELAMGNIGADANEMQPSK